MAPPQERCGGSEAGPGSPSSDGACDSCLSSSNASSASTDSDSEGDCSAAGSPTAAQGGGAAAASVLGGQQQQQEAHAGRSRARRGSVLPGAATVARDLGPPLVEFFEAEGPHLRLPLSERIEELAGACPALRALSSDAVHPASWFAVSWYPLYRIPSVVDPHVARDLQAGFLTFHSLASPAGGGCPVPPPPSAQSAAVLAWRTEAARQRLLMAALSSAMSAAALGEGASPEAATAAEAVRSLAAQQVPLNATCLRPFAFMPYKVGGAVARGRRES